MARMACTWATNGSADPVIASGPISPTAGQNRRSDRGPINHRTACCANAPMPSRAASSAHSAEQLAAPLVVAGRRCRPA